MKAWQIFLLSLVIGFLATITVASTLASPDGIKFCKWFRGNIASIEGPITIKDADTGQVYFSGRLPLEQKICIYIPHNTTVLIQWKDWRGQMSERHLVLCKPDGTDELINCIPYPKSGEIGSG